MKAVIYARFSSENQREESIEGQIRECKEYAERNGMEIVGTYCDRALSARTDNRPSFQKMIKDSSKHLFDIVLVWKLDRFARNRYDSAKYKHTLKKEGVRVVSAREAISEGPEGILLESMLEGWNEYFSADLAEKVLRGMTENALKCMNNGTAVPLGYIVDDTQHLQIDESTACYVREIFTRYADGEKVMDIMRDMNARGVRVTYKLEKSRQEVKVHKRPLTYNKIRRILSNRKYIGEYSYKDIVIPGGVPRIIEDDLFNKVQQRLEQNKRAPAKHKADDDYLLTLKLFCGKCHAAMVGECGTSHTAKTYRYYKCITQKRKHACDKKAVNKEYIENKVIEAIKAKIFDDELMEHLADTIFDLQAKEDPRIPQLKARHAEIQQSINNMLDAIQQGIILPSTKQRLAELEQQKAECEIELVEQEIKSPSLTRDQILWGLLKYRELDLTTLDGRKKLIDGFVNSIYLYDDGCILTCNYKDGTVKIPFEEIQGSDLLNSGVPKNISMLRMGIFFSTTTRM